MRCFVVTTNTALTCVAARNPEKLQIHRARMMTNRAEMATLKRLSSRVCDPNRPLHEQHECQRVIDRMRQVADEQTDFVINYLTDSDSESEL
tara:strand:- start:822 stop:1097 length:276 start_codon:yes stop_codon:yes gene_type:complete